MLTSSLLAAALLVGALCTSASANLAKEIQLLVPALDVEAPVDTLQPNDAHLTFMNTGGIKGVESKSPYIDGIIINGETLEITFTDKLPANTVVVLNFDVTQDDPKLSFVNGIWTNNGIPIAPINPAHVRLLRKMPGASATGMILLSLVILGSGVYVLGRRRAAIA
jgi:hypothetical protein